MKKNWINKILAILVVILISIVSFFGIYVKDKNKYVNKVPDYQFGMDIEGSRVITIKPDDSKETKTYDADGNLVEDADSNTEENKEGQTTVEEPVNKDEVLTAENYKKSKSVIEKRLEMSNILEYTIRQDESTGAMTIQIPDDSKADKVIANLTESGKFEIVDSETKDVLMNNDDLKETKVGIAQQSATTGSYNIIAIQIGFNKQGQAKFKDLTNTYKTVDSTATTDSDNNDSSEESSEESKQKEITLKINGEDILTTSFDQEMTNGVMQLTMGNKNTDSDTLQEYYTQASNLAASLNSGITPVIYTVDNELYEDADLPQKNIVLISVAVVAAIFAVVLVIRFKLKGLLAIISNIGFVATLMLLIRLSNVTLTIEGLVTICFAAVLNYLFIWSLIYENSKTEEKDAFSKVMLKSINIAIPLMIASIVFTFSSWLPLASCGMVGIWTIITWIIYSFVITKYISRN